VIIKLDPQVVAAVADAFGVGPDHVHAPRYFGPHAGIRCGTCNAPVEPDPRVGRTAASPSANTAATAAAVAGRGERCANCGHWTFAAPAVPTPGRPTVSGRCRNCADLGTGEPRLIRLTGSGTLSARFLR
jgi:hypothetical protein